MKIDYRRALAYVFENPDWGRTLLFVTLALLVPLVGPLVAFGYQAAIIEALARGGASAPLPTFDLERVTDYLLRGLRIFVVTIVVTFVVVPVGMVIIGGGNVVALLLISQEQPATTLLGWLVIAVMAVLFTVALALAIALVTPLMVRAALLPDIGAVFDLAFTRDFLQRAGRETVITHLAHVVINVGLFIAGALACFVGVFPALAIGTLVQAHLLGQLYLLYLERGGQRI